MCPYAFIYTGGLWYGMSSGISWWASWGMRQGTAISHINAGGVTTASVLQLEINRYSEINRLTTGAQQTACQIELLLA